MRIVVDREMCEANAVCVGEAAEVFSLDEEGALVVLVERPGAHHLGDVHQAVRRCPRGALSLVDDDPVP
jgi:ferredoxin